MLWPSHNILTLRNLKSHTIIVWSGMMYTIFVQIIDFRNSTQIQRASGAPVFKTDFQICIGRRQTSLVFFVFDLFFRFRIGFRIPVISVEDAKSEVLKVFQEAWEKGNGYDWGEEEAGHDIPILKIAEDSLE